MFKSTDHQSNTLIGGDTINFYTYFTDPAGNSNSFTNVAVPMLSLTNSQAKCYHI